MESFGPFQVVSEIGSSTGSTVYKAQKEGDPKGEYAVKVFSLQGIVSGQGEELEAELEPLFQDLGASFTARISLQKQAAESSRLFAPILAGGQDERGVWYATNFYSRSVEGMLERFVALEAPDLFQIVQSVTAAALHLKKTSGRSHGNLKPSNIFVAGEGKPRNSRVLVADPLPGDAQEARSYELADLRAIGELIYQLVVKKKVDFTWVMVPHEPSGEWTRLFEKDAAAWLVLCQRLLEPGLTLDNISLEEVERELLKFKAKRPVAVIVIPIAAGMVLLAGIAGYFLFFKSTKGKLEVKVDPPGSALIITPLDEVEREIPAQSRTNAPSRGGKFTLRLEPGDYRIKAAYLARNGAIESPKVTVKVEKNKTSSTGLIAPYGGLAVTSDPSGAEFLLGTEKARTPFADSYMRTGHLELRLEVPGHETAVLLGDIQPQIKTDFSTNLVKIKAGEVLVEFTSDPSGAQIYVDKDPSSFTTPYKKPMTEGRHKVSAVFKGWAVPAPSRTSTVEMDVSRAKGENQPQFFHFDHGAVQLLGQIEGTEVLVNGESAGVSQTNLFLPPGRYNVEFRKPGYYPFPTNLALVNGTTNQVLLALRAREGIVELASDPPGARVEVRNQKGNLLTNVITDGQISFPLPPGTNVFQATHGDLELVSKRVIIEPGVTNLVKLPFNYGKVLFQNIEPPDARIQGPGGKRVDIGKPIFQKPDGVVSYQVEAEGYERLSTNVTVPLNQTKQVSLTLLRTNVPVQLMSDPPGAGFSTRDGTELKASAKDYYLVPWGPVDLVARHGRLGARTNSVTIKLGTQNLVPFKFQYGTLWLTNLPPDAEVYETNERVGSPADARAYEKPEQHVYTVRRKSRAEVTITTNIVAFKDNYLTLPPTRDMASSIGMVLVAVPGLAGGGRDIFVGRCEVTQAEYKKVMSENPSDPQDDSLPVNNVSADKVQDFCRRLTGLDRQASVLPEGYSYVLPTVEQWASLAKSADASQGIFSPPSPAPRLTGPKPVASLAVDGNGLCGLYGNVWEIALSGGAYKKRGGSYFETMVGYRGAFDDKFSQPSRYVGFRVVLAPVALAGKL